ncbi:MAG TPA: hypothetical protein VFR47_01415 [Anaerolineales bacterium]|nr:hypothetical protein [Anaerolineales bacterium]
MDYELYHDESLEGGYWHGMLLVPAWNKKEFSDLLATARANTRYFDKIGIKKVDRKGLIYNCASAWTQIGVACLRSSAKGKAEPVFLGRQEKGRIQYEQVRLSGLKFILFRERDAHKDLSTRGDHASKIETTFRFGIKGGLHFLGSEENPIHLTRIHFDGHQHHQRHIDQDRILRRIGSLRKYCTISRCHDLIDDRQSDHKKPQSQEYEDCQFLQLTDLLIGCFRTSLGYKTRAIHVELARPVKNLVDKYHEGPSRMKKSRWANSFVISQCSLENGRWGFEGIQRNQNEVKQPKML